MTGARRRRERPKIVFVLLSDVGVFRRKRGNELFSVQIRERPRKGKGKPFRDEDVPSEFIFFIQSLVAVLFVARNGMSGKSQMRAYLVRLSAVQPHFHAGKFSEALRVEILGNDLFRALLRLGKNFHLRCGRVLF